MNESSEDRGDSLELLLAAVKEAIDANRQSAAKWNKLYDWFKSTFGVNRSEVAGKLLTESKQLSNRIKKELPQKRPRYVVLTAIGDDFDTDDVVRHLAESNLPQARCAIIFKSTEPVHFFVYERDGVVNGLEEMLSETVTAEERARPIVSSSTAPAPVPGVASAFAAVPILIDDRVRRMVRLAIASTPAVILVGPPGCGKTVLLSEVIAEIRDDPERFGFSMEFNDALWATPEESWTTTDLVGGQTVDDKGRIRFRPGYVLDAIAQERWLVLDEANRADMDKIFGGLLTWLGGQTVELGRVATNLGAPPVRLEWGDQPDCKVERAEELDTDEPSGDPIRYIAGTEWRLLGTYNALDAHRVFRWGQAIGRRFARVPIPTATAEQFHTALTPLVDDLPAWVGQGIASLYTAHKEDQTTELGPAVFMRMADYIRAGMAGLGGEVDPELEGEFGREPEAAMEEAASEMPVAEIQVHGMSTDDEEQATETLDAGDSPSRALLAEAYLVHAGTWLARLEDVQLDSLRQRVVVERGAVSETEWSWIVSLAHVLG